MVVDFNPGLRVLARNDNDGCNHDVARNDKGKIINNIEQSNILYM